MLTIAIPGDAIVEMFDKVELTGLASDIYDYFWADFYDREKDAVVAHPNVIGNLAFLLLLLQKQKHPSLRDICDEFEYLDPKVTYSELKEDLLQTLGLPQDQIRVRVECIFQDLKIANSDNRADYLSEMEHQEEMRRYYNWGRFH